MDLERKIKLRRIVPFSLIYFSTRPPNSDVYYGGRLCALPLHEPVIGGDAEANMIKDLGVESLKKF